MKLIIIMMFMLPSVLNLAVALTRNKNNGEYPELTIVTVISVVMLLVVIT